MLDKVDLLLEFGVLLTYKTNEGNQLDWIGISWGFVLLPKKCVVFLQLNAYFLLLDSQALCKKFTWCVKKFTGCVLFCAYKCFSFHYYDYFWIVTGKLKVQTINCSECQNKNKKIFMYTTCSELLIFMYWTRNSMNNLLAYCGLLDARISDSEKD